MARLNVLLTLALFALFSMLLSPTHATDSIPYWVDPEGLEDPEAIALVEAEKAWWLENESPSEYTYFPSGVKYKVLKSKINPETLKSGTIFVKPSLEAVIRAHYEVRLTDGTIVEQSWAAREGKEAMDFDAAVAQVSPRSIKMSSLTTTLVPGVREALLQMTLDDEYEVVIPSRLAFGPVSVGRAFRKTIRAPIPAYSTLIFRIHIHDILFFDPPGSNKLRSSKPSKEEL